MLFATAKSYLTSSLFTFTYYFPKNPLTFVNGFSFGADYGARTRHLDLGKVALYQMS